MSIMLFMFCCVSLQTTNAQMETQPSAALEVSEVSTSFLQQVTTHLLLILEIKYVCHLGPKCK